jgi:hypothetical protein
MSLTPWDYVSLLRLNVYTRAVPSGYDSDRLMLIVNDLAKYYLLTPTENRASIAD